MANTLLGPWDPQSPVNFYEGGDTVTQAFGKHIQEIERIYGLLNALDAGKVSHDELTEILRSYVTLTYLNTKLGEYVTNTAFNNHVYSGDPHPNMTLPFSKITGDVPASRVSGNLSNATIDNSRVNGLIDAIRNNSSSVISEITDNSIKLSNNVLIQWGSGSLPLTFPRAYSQLLGGACSPSTIAANVSTHGDDTLGNVTTVGLNHVVITNTGITYSGTNQYQGTASYIVVGKV